jgi:hypothetical protein
MEGYLNQQAEHFIHQLSSKLFHEKTLRTENRLEEMPKLVRRDRKTVSYFLEQYVPVMELDDLGNNLKIMAFLEESMRSAK